MKLEESHNRVEPQTDKTALDRAIDATVQNLLSQFKRVKLPGDDSSAAEKQGGYWLGELEADTTFSCTS